MIGSIEKDGDKANIKTTISSNKTYGDVIYTTEATVTTGEATTTKETTFNSLNEYYFGGIVGYVNANANSTTISGNIVAFTNNNQLRGGKLHFADAIVGMVAGDDDGASTSVIYGDDEEHGYNYYSSQLVLATSDNAIDLNYETKGASGYTPNNATTTTPDATIIDKLAAEVGDYFGTKLKPITDGTATTSSSNGITYYTTQYPETQSDPYAFIGDWVEQDDTLTTLNEHSFISGVSTNLNFEDIEDPKENKNVKANDTNRGGIVDTMNGGIVYACISAGTLSVGGNVQANVGGIVGSMVSGYINECSSSLNVTYRAGGYSEGNGGTASAVAVVLAGNAKKIFINNTYTSGNVTSYIDANLYAFVNGTDSTNISNSYTISRISWNDYTSSKTTPDSTIKIGISGSSLKAGFSYDPDAMGDAYGEENTETQLDKPDEASDSTALPNWIYPASNSTSDSGSINISGWSKSADVNYGYPVRNFGAFKAYKTQETVVEGESAITYDLIPNITKLKQTSGTNQNYKLVNDIDLAKTSYSGTLDDSPKFASVDFTYVEYFDGDGHTISNLKDYTLFSKVKNISNLRVMDAELTNQRAVVALNVTGSASNVIASGTLSYSGTLTADKYIGGVFAYASESIDGCKNYVKMDVTCDGIDIGGVVGKSVGTKISNCFNYAPINAVNKNANGGGGYVAGVVGSWSASATDSTVSNCGNENTVFNGYTKTVDSDEIENDNNYSAAGIVGWTNTAGSISNCYNTSMIKAGNKGINKTSGSSKAAGIVASTTGSVSSCTNTGFIEALGSTSEAITQFKINTPWSEYTDAGKPLKDTWANDSSSTTTSQGYIYKLNATDIKNVYVSQIALNNSSVEIGSSCSATGSVYKNGLFGSVEDSVELTPPSYEPGLIGTEGNTTAKELSLHSGDIKIYFANEKSDKPTPIIAETDELGMMTKFYIKSTRTIMYANSITKTQTRYWNVVDINGLHTGASYSANQNYYAQQATQSQKYEVSSYTEPSTTTTSSSGDVQNVTISGNTYAFVEDVNGFTASVNNQTKTEKFDVEGTIGGKSISDLVDQGYKFNVGLEYNKEYISTARADVSVGNDDNDGKKLSISIKYVPVRNVNGYASINYTITASKEDERIEHYLNASTLIFEEGTVKIYYSDTSGLAGGGQYKIEDKVFTYSIGTNGALSYFSYSGSDAEDVYNDLKNKGSVSIIINEGDTIDATQSIVLNTSSQVDSISTENEKTYFSNTDRPWLQSYAVENSHSYSGTSSWTLTNSFQIKGKLSSFDVSYKYDNTDGFRADWEILDVKDQDQFKSTSHFNFGSFEWNECYVRAKMTYNENSKITTILLECIWSWGSLLEEEEMEDLSSNVSYTFHFDNEGDEITNYLEDDFATYSYTTNTSGEKQLQVAVKDGAVTEPTLVIASGKAKLITPSSTSKTLTFDGEVSSISKIGISKAEWEDAVTFNDSNSDEYVDQIVFKIKENCLAIYTVNDITKSISSTATDRELVFDLDDNLTSLTITRKALLYNSSSSITYEDEGIVKVDEEPTATVYTLRPVLYKVFYDEDGNINNFTDVEINAENTFVLNGITYTATLDSENLIITSVSQGGQDYTTIFPESLINLNGKLYYYALAQTEGTLQMSLLEAYLGEGGIINVDGTDFIYEVYGEPNNYAVYLYDLSLNPISKDEDTGSYIINSSTFILEEYLKESVTVEPSVEDGKLTVNAPEGSTFDLFSVIELNYQAKAPSVNIVLPIENNTYTLEKDDYVDEITYTTDDETPVTSSPKNITFGPCSQGTQIEITKKYNNYSNNKATEYVGLTSSSTSYYSGIVLTKDITIGTLSEDLILNYNLAGNGKVINFVRRSNAKNSLFNDSIKDEIFIKDVSIAGSLIYPEENTGIIAKEISSSLINTNVYGTIDLDRSLTCGGVAYKINSNPTKLKSYVSISHDTSNVTRSDDNNSTGNMAGVAWEMSGGTYVDYYGTIIGTNGSHGTTYDNDGTKNGEDGQGVFALARKISSTPTNFTFGGIIKSGDGGSGSRGLDGKEGTDGWAGISIDRNGIKRENIRHLYLDDESVSYYEFLANKNSDPGYHNPTKGTDGNSGGGAGANGGVFEYENSSNNSQKKITASVENSTPIKGQDGNNGWIGVNMLQYVDFRHWKKSRPRVSDLNTIVTGVITNGGTIDSVALNVSFMSREKDDFTFSKTEGNYLVGINCVTGPATGGTETVYVDEKLINSNFGDYSIKSVGSGYVNVNDKILILAYRYAKHGYLDGQIRAKDCEKRFIVIDDPVSAECS